MEQGRTAAYTPGDAGEATHSLPGATPSDSAGAPARLGAYDLLGEIARGGMGVVYRARHTTLNRDVALKVSRTGLLASASELKRFHAEVEAAGQLDHPNIVPVYEAGEADGYHYFSMALVSGRSLAERIAERPLSPREAAELMRHSAAAVAYAHDRGVVHRDLKPGNILLDSSGQPRITDFGLAKRAGADSSLTQAGQVMGTPSFMPPEQAQGKNEQVGPLADVYSLGATLYALLTGRPPFQSASVVDTLKLVVEQEPISPRSLNPAVDRDLETICLKCLQKRPERRYASAAELGEDLQRFLDRRPILARPVGVVERGVRWCRRNPAVAASLAAIVAVFVAAFALVSGSYLRAEQARENESLQRQEAERKEQAERRERYRSNLIAAGTAMRLHNVAAARDALEAAPEEHRGWEWRHYIHQLDTADHVHRGFGPTGLAIGSPDRRMVLLYSGPDESIFAFDTITRHPRVEIEKTRHAGLTRFSRDGTLVAFNTIENTVEVWNLVQRRLQVTLKGHAGRVVWLDFDADGRLATGSQDRTCRIWNATNGETIRTLGPHPGAVGRVAFGRDGTRLFAQSGTSARLWDTNTGQSLGEYPRAADAVGDTSASPVQDWLAISAEYPSNRITLFDLATNRIVSELSGHTNQTRDLAFRPDGKLFASASYDQTIRLWNPEDGKPVAVLKGHDGWVNSIDFSPDGRRIVSASQDQTVRLWDASTGDSLAVLHGHTSDIELVKYVPGGGSVVSVARDGSLRWFDMDRAERSGSLRGHTSFVYGVAVHPDGERIASASWDGTVRVWHATTGRELAVLKHSDGAIVTSVAFHPDGRHLVSQGRDDDVRLWDLETNKLIHRFPLPTQLWRDSRLAFSRDGKFLAAGAKDNTVHIWDFATRREIVVLAGHTQIVRDLAFSPDGSWLATASELGDGTVRIWDVATGKQTREVCRMDNSVYALAISSDGRSLAAGSHDGTVRVWNTDDWSERANLKQGTNSYGLAFHPDGSRLAVATANNTIRLWDVETSKLVAELHGHSAYVHQVAFSPDGTRIVSASGDKTLRVWDTLSAAERAKR